MSEEQWLEFQVQARKQQVEQQEKLALQRYRMIFDTSPAKFKVCDYIGHYYEVFVAANGSKSCGN